MQSSTFLFESLEVFQDYFSCVVVDERHVCSVSINTAALDLPLNAMVTFSHDLSDDQAPSTLDYDDEFQGTLSLEVVHDTSEIHDHISYFECRRLIASKFSLAPSQLALRMAWRMQVITCLVTWVNADGLCREAYLSICSNTQYYEPSTGLLLASESEVRVSPTTGLHQAELCELLQNGPSLPSIAEYWMAEYHYKRLMRLPTHQDLVGYEYEAKLSVSHLTLNNVPKVLSERYQVIERYQTESIRWYLENVEIVDIGKVKKARIGFRGARASLVTKGKKHKLEGGILKRREQKKQGLNTWTLDLSSQDVKEMRRIKRQLYLRSKQSHRVYALCLDYCYVEGSVGSPLLQVELEYNGLLLVEPSRWILTIASQLELAETFLHTSPKLALRCIERVEWLMTNTPIDEWEQSKLESLKDMIARQKVVEASDRDAGKLKSLEEEVLSEMRELLHSLKEEWGYEQTHQTKRKWLKTMRSSIEESLP